MCRSAHTRPIVPAINDALRIVTGCLRPTPVDNLTSSQASNLLSFVAMEPQCLQRAVPWSLGICSTHCSPVHRMQTHDAPNRGTHSTTSHLTTTTYVRRSGRISNGMRSGRTTPQDSSFSSPTLAPTPRNDPPKKSLGPA